jgi:hypothetical protein
MSMLFELVNMGTTYIMRGSFDNDYLNNLDYRTSINLKKKILTQKKSFLYRLIDSILNFI